MVNFGKGVFNSAGEAIKDCVFCKIVTGKLPAYIVYEDQKYIAFLDLFPFSEGHTLVCPKKHGETVWDMSETEIGGLFMLASKISKAIVSAVNADGFRFVQNNGEAANQVVQHVHVHIIPVKLSEKGRFMERKKFSTEELTKISSRIRARIE